MGCPVLLQLHDCFVKYGVWFWGLGAFFVFLFFKYVDLFHCVQAQDDFEAKRWARTNCIIHMKV